VEGLLRDTWDPMAESKEKTPTAVPTPAPTVAIARTRSERAGRLEHVSAVAESQLVEPHRADARVVLAVRSAIAKFNPATVSDA
jgi:hypothetical protein